MTTTVLFPHHNHSFGESDSYAQAISAMSAGNGHFFNHYSTTETPESTNYDIRAFHQQIAPWEWDPAAWALSQHPTQALLPSQPPLNPNPISTANVNPIALSAPVFTPANQATGYYDSPSSASPSKSHFDTSCSASPASQDTYQRRDSLYPREGDTSSQHSPAATNILTPTPTAAAAPTTTRRRRNTEYVEPGSARAIYLEKNRRAASKCRSKQKHEQEQLVERSRLYERKNRLLKAERDLLQAEVRALKDLLGQHTHCPDQRIAQYLQREANRLASTQEFHGPF